jgi:hypothetical protein
MSTGLNLSDRVYHYDTNPAIRAELPSCPSSRNQYGELLETLRSTLSNGDPVAFKIYEDIVVTTFRGIRFELAINAFNQINLSELPQEDALEFILKLSRLSKLEA